MLSQLSKESERTQPYWFVMRAYKNEKTAEEKLSKEGLEFYIPKQYAVRVYHGVKSKRLVPVIPGLIFVHGSHNQLVDFKKQQYNLLQFVIWETSEGPSYLIVPDKQMESFIKISFQHEEQVDYFTPEEINIKKGTRVRILGGEFDGVEGYFMSVKGRRNRRVVVLLDGVMAIATEVKPDLIEVVDAE